MSLEVTLSQEIQTIQTTLGRDVIVNSESFAGPLREIVKMLDLELAIDPSTIINDLNEALGELDSRIHEIEADNSHGFTETDIEFLTRVVDLKKELGELFKADEQLQIANTTEVTVADSEKGASSHDFHLVVKYLEVDEEATLFTEVLDAGQTTTELQESGLSLASDKKVTAICHYVLNHASESGVNLDEFYDPNYTSIPYNLDNKPLTSGHKALLIALKEGIRSDSGFYYYYCGQLRFSEDVDTRALTYLASKK